METYLQTIIIKGSRVPATGLKTREREAANGREFGSDRTEAPDVHCD
jgi:hypothetical protein